MSEKETCFIRNINLVPRITVKTNVKLSLRTINFQKERMDLELNGKQYEYMLFHVNIILVPTVSLGILEERKS
jgi:ABC-type uncharacterized transport system involved in gliding motility auxiliary subunit